MLIKRNLYTFPCAKVKIKILTPIYTHQCSNPLINSCHCPKVLKTNNIKYLGIIIDDTLSFKQHIESLVSRVRKLMFVFKKLRTIADPKLITQIYLALCQSILTYCITSWGGAPKTTMLPLERAQRAILKVAHFHPFLFPTDQLYKSCNVLTVRQLFILHVILKQHSQLSYNNSNITNKRRKDIVCSSNSTSKYMYTNRFFRFLGPFLYNKLNSELSIYSLNYFKCRKSVFNYLQSLSYDRTDNLLTVCK